MKNQRFFFILAPILGVVPIGGEASFLKSFSLDDKISLGVGLSVGCAVTYKIYQGETLSPVQKKGTETVNSESLVSTLQSTSFEEKETRSLTNEKTDENSPKFSKGVFLKKRASAFLWGIGAGVLSFFLCRHLIQGARELRYKPLRRKAADLLWQNPKKNLEEWEPFIQAGLDANEKRNGRTLFYWVASQEGFNEEVFRNLLISKRIKDVNETIGSRGIFDCLFYNKNRDDQIISYFLSRSDLQWQKKPMADILTSNRFHLLWSMPPLEVRTNKGYGPGSAFKHPAFLRDDEFFNYWKQLKKWKGPLNLGGGLIKRRARLNLRHIRRFFKLWQEGASFSVEDIVSQNSANLQWILYFYTRDRKKFRENSDALFSEYKDYKRGGTFHKACEKAWQEALGMKSQIQIENITDLKYFTQEEGIKFLQSLRRQSYPQTLEHKALMALRPHHDLSKLSEEVLLKLLHVTPDIGVYYKALVLYRKCRPELRDLCLPREAFQYFPKTLEKDFWVPLKWQGFLV